MVSGVAQVQVFGSQKYAVRVQLDPTRSPRAGSASTRSQKALAQATSTCPRARSRARPGVHRPGQRPAHQRRRLPAAHRRLPQRRARPARAARPRHRQRGERQDRQLVQRRRARSSSRSSASPAPTPWRWSTRSRSLLPAFRAQLPASVKLDILFDRSQSIRESVHDVEFTLVLAIALVVLVIFLFLRNLSATLIPSLALPMSIVGTFAVMYLLGLQPGQPLADGADPAVGFVVDDAIVMLENIVRHMEMGEGRMEAALERLARDRLHHRLDDHLPGRRVHPRAVHGRAPRPAAPRVRGHHRRRHPRLRLRLADAHADAVQPLPAPRRTDGHGRLYRASERVFDGMLARTSGRSRSSCAHRGSRWSCLRAQLGATGVALRDHAEGFIPSEDTGQIFVFTEAAQDISFDSMVEHQQAVAAIVARDIPTSTASCRRSAPAAPTPCNTGPLFIALKPRAERGRHARTRSSRSCGRSSPVIPGMRVFPQILPSIRIGGQLTKSLYQFTLQGADLAELYRWAPELSKLRALPGFLDVTSDLQITSPQVRGRHRPRQGLGAGRDRRADRERALQRLRLPPGLDHLHADEPVPGDHGAPAGVPAGSRRALACSTSARSNGKPRPAATSRAPSSRARAGPAHRQAPRPAPRGHALVQPGPGVALGDAVARGEAGASRSCGCPRRSAPASRARPRRSSPRSRGLGLLLLAASS